MTKIIDSEGTTFDPFTHNLLDNPPRPEETETGKFRKARGAGNSDDLIERYLEAVEAQANGYVDTKADVAGEVVAKPNAEKVSAKALADSFGAKLFQKSDDLYRFSKNGYSVTLNLSGIETERDARTALNRAGLR